MGNYLEARKRTNTGFSRLNSALDKERIWQRDGFTIGTVVPASARKEASSPAPVEDCLPILIDWPFSADENGIPFDQANLYGMSYRAPRHDSDYKDFIPIPKTIPASYTLMHPRNGVFGHENPAQLFEQVRTPTGVINRSSLPQNRYSCKPGTRMNMADPGVVSYPVNTGFGLAANSDIMAGPYQGGIVLWTGGTVGLRGCAYQYRLESVLLPPAGGGTFGGWCRITFLMDLDPAAPWNRTTNANPPAFLCSMEGTDTAVSVPGSAVFNAVPTAGFVTTFYAVLQAQYTDIRDAYSHKVNVIFSESTQIPWCHSIAYGNKVAAGGLLNPYS